MAAETVFMFSGQGSQYFQMGKALYDGNETFRQWMLQLDEIAKTASGRSIVEVLYADSQSKSDPFDRTLLTHPAIFMVEFALAQALIKAGVRPDIVLGVSMGSFAAAAVAGFIEVEDALTAVIRQAISLEECSEPGGMTAILNEPALFAEEFISGRAELAGVNFSTHFVVSSRKMDLGEIEAVLRQRNIAYQRLPVSFPFHSQWIDKAKAPFASFMQNVRCKPGRLPLLCCDQAALLSNLSGGFFWDVVRHPIHFRETIAKLGQGTRRYIDVGPAGTLATFFKYGIPGPTHSTVHAILTPYSADQKNFAAVCASNA